MKETLVNTANKVNILELLEAPFCVRSNDELHRISERIREETGALDSQKIFFEWNEWLKRAVKK